MLAHYIQVPKEILVNKFYWNLKIYLNAQIILLFA